MAFSPFHVPFLLGSPPPPQPPECRLEAQVGVCKAALEVLQSSRMATRHVTEALKIRYNFKENIVVAMWLIIPKIRKHDG